MTSEVSLNALFRVDVIKIATFLRDLSVCLNLKIADVGEPFSDAVEACEPVTIKASPWDMGNTVALDDAGTLLSYTRELQGLETYGCLATVRINVGIRCVGLTCPRLPKTAEVEFQTCANGEPHPVTADSSSESGLIVSIHPYHDANVAVLRLDGSPLFVLELERLARKRYFRGMYAGGDSMASDVKQVWSTAADLVRRRLLSEFVVKENFELGVFNPCYGQFKGYFGERKRAARKFRVPPGTVP